MKKGFTLIELLAVIVILAVIALIAVPIILSLIEDSRRETAIASANGYVRAVNYKIAQEVLNDRTVADDDYVIGENALIVSGKNIENITGSYTILNERVLWAGLCINGYSVEYNSITGYSGISTSNYCGNSMPYAYEYEEEKTYQSIDALCTGSSADSIYSDTTNYKIEKIDDLVCLSNLVNSGKNFSGKSIYLINDLDFNSDNSYKKDNGGNITTAYGDINGDSTTSDLKTELTTGAGFKPIGTENKPFSGTFNGYAQVISNLKISRNTSYVGLFGNNAGTIKGLIIRDASVTANNSSAWYAGILAGYSVGTISSIDVQGNITSTGNYVGGIVGYIYKSNGASTAFRSLIFKGNATGFSGVAGLAGQAIGYNYQGDGQMIFQGVVYDSAITATTTNTSPAWGVHYTSGNGNYLNKNLRYKNTTVTRASNIAVTGTYEGPITSLTLEAVDGALDTYIGGDNDSDGYYFDYDTGGNIVLYSLLRRPFNYDDATRKLKDLKGSGTAESPYLIKNAFDWRVASSTINTAKYYSVTSDLNFESNKFYALGTAANHFKGNINGNLNTLSNITIYGNTYTGMFGYNTGTIEGFRIDGLTINSTGIYTGMVAYNTGLIKGIEVKNATVTPGKDSSNQSYSGIIAGYSPGSITSVSAQGNITSTGNYVGGIVGYIYKSNVTSTFFRSAMFTGNVTSLAYAAGLAGYAYGYNYQGDGQMDFKGVVYNSAIKVTTTDTSTTWGVHYTSGNGNYLNKNLRYKNTTVTRASTIAVTSTYEGPINGLTLEAVDGALDTYIGGDNDSDGYYFDYDASGNIILYSTANNPIVNTLAGSGTQNDPYQINSYADWKIASAFTNTNKYFKLNTDIDFASNKFYALGTLANKFNSYIDGNMNTLSNITIYGNTYTGMFGYNQGTIEGFRINGLTINSTGVYTGMVAYNTNAGLIKGIEVRSAAVTAGKDSSDWSYGGIIAGYSLGTISSVDVQGNITSSGQYVGGIVGYICKERNKTNAFKNAMFTGNVTSLAYAAGLAGYAYGYDYQGVGRLEFKGVVHDSTIKVTTTNTSTTWGIYYTSGNGNYLEKVLKYKDVTVIRASNITVQNYETPESNLDAQTLDGALDTYIGGDNDNDGYYFGDCSGSLTLLSKKFNPIDGNSCPQSVTPSEETTYLGIVYLNPKNLSATCNAQNSVSTTGTKEGCMKFYIYKDDGTNYTMILDHNTTATIAWANQADFVEAGGSLSEWQTNEGSTSEGPVTANKQLVLDTTGWSGNPRLITANEIATITGASTSLSWNSSKTYANPVTDKSTQIGKYYFDGSGTSYSGWTSSVATASNKSAYAWLFDNTNTCIQYGCNSEVSNTTFGYWTSDSHSIDYPWVVLNTGSLGDNNVTNTSNVGIRPVITLPKTSVTVN